MTNKIAKNVTVFSLLAIAIGCSTFGSIDYVNPTCKDVTLESSLIEIQNDSEKPKKDSVLIETKVDAEKNIKKFEFYVEIEYKLVDGFNTYLLDKKVRAKKFDETTEKIKEGKSITMKHKKKFLEVAEFENAYGEYEFESIKGTSIQDCSKDS
jgi:hypothetical protein